MDTAEACETYGATKPPEIKLRYTALTTAAGPLVRVGPNELITSDPDVLRKILSIRSAYRRSNWYDALRIDPTHNNVLSERNDEKHNALRAKMAAGVYPYTLYPFTSGPRYLLMRSTPEKKTNTSNARSKIMSQTS